MEIISELETGPREIYCGAIVLLEAEGLQISIPIRTGILDAEGLQLRSGGGIVLDSEPEMERLETVRSAGLRSSLNDRGRSFRAAIERKKASRQGRCALGFGGESRSR